jgi:hypothetical protein
MNLAGGEVPVITEAFWQHLVATACATAAQAGDGNDRGRFALSRGREDEKAQH